MSLSNQKQLCVECWTASSVNGWALRRTYDRTRRRVQADLLGELLVPFAPIERDLGPAIAALWALYESTFRDACVMEWTQDEATTELGARLQMINLGQQKRARG